MNKKFSTLMAGLLLASAFTANAAGAVKDTLTVDPAQGLIPGTYLLYNQAGDSVVTQAALTSPNYGKLSFAKVKATASNAAQVEIAKVGKGYYFSIGSNTVYVYTDGKLLSNATGKDYAIFNVTEEGYLVASQYRNSGTAEKAKNDTISYLKSGVKPTDLVKQAEGASLAQFTFKMLVDQQTAPSGSAAIADDAVAGKTLLLQIDGNYVGVKAASLRAIGVNTNTLQLGPTEPAADEIDLYTWAYDGVGYVSIVTGQYLTVGTNGKLTTSDDPVPASVSGGVLTINGVNVAAVNVYSSAVPFPFEPAVATWEAEEYLTNGAYYVLTANGQVIGSNDALVDYEDAGHTAQVYQANVVKLGTNNYVVRFANKENGELLEVGGQYVQVPVTAVTSGAHKGQYLIADNGEFLLTNPNGDMVTADLTPTSNIYEAVTFGAVAVEDRFVTMAELQSVYGASFGTTLKRADGKALVNNPFTGKLAPVSQVKVQNGHYLKAPAGTYMLQKENGNLIAVSPAKYANRTDATYGYKVVEISPKDLYLALNETTPKAYAYGFQLYAPGSTFVGEDAAASYILAKDDNAATYRLGALEVDGVGIALSAEQGDDHIFTNALQIKLGTFTKIDLTELLAKPSFYQVTVKNVNKNSANYGKVLGLENAWDGGYVKASEALVGYPEAQWAIVTDAEGSTMQFVNREQNGVIGLTLDPTEVYTTDVKNVFSVPSTVGRDTIEIKPVATAETDGYLHLATSEWKNNLYYVGVNSSVWKGLAYVTENHKDDHKLGLDIDKADATKWKLTAPWIYEKNVLGEVTDNYQETIDVAHTLWYWNASKGEFVNTDKDGKKTVHLTIPVYNFMNSANSEYMYYNGSAMVLSEHMGNAEYFALKENAAGKYNLVRYDRYNNALNPQNDKIYGGDSADKGILNMTHMYNQTENDIFSIEVAEAPEYVKLNYGDKIKIYRDEQESNVLYEKGEFAGIGNAVEFDKINPALYVDTAWMNRDEVVNRYDYLLAVNAKQATKAYECNVPDHKHLYHYTDTTYGRFLVNLVDSAIVEAERDIHTNKYLYDEYQAKLGFVDAKHTEDKLIIASSKDTIEVGTPAYNLVKFAFRTVDPEAGTFVIETGYKSPSKTAELYETPGYLRWINGNLVVTAYRGDAEVFSLKATENEATANEAIEASEVVVIAGKGVVTVQGAAGKVVTVSNILGQTIANQVAASDNVTIAAPAGVVVVAVDGEATKVVVK